ncbi:uncharacterized protein LOC119169391 isoform X2 [Rhipicephalus microplus]|uniref:uncharacterized protein LOC119169391 isoform X2 n=1 Tax=Rhipicephalus microplus TaxID=6941 RepID=UPI003F6A61C8
MLTRIGTQCDIGYDDIGIRQLKRAMLGNYLFMCSVLVMASTAFKNTGNRPCERMKNQCQGHTRPNCLFMKHNTRGWPKFMCTLKSQECHSAWGRECGNFVSISCYIHKNYCECLCELRPNNKSRARSPRRSSPGRKQLLLGKRHCHRQSK